MTGYPSKFRSPTNPSVYRKYRKGHPEIWATLANAICLDGRSITIDMGCGPGVEAEAFMQASAGLYVGVDRAYEAIETARQALSEMSILNFVCAQTERLPFKEASADLVTFMISLHQMSDVDIILAEASRILKEKGFIAVVGVPPEQWSKAVEFRFFPELMEKESRRHCNFTTENVLDLTSKYIKNVSVTWLPYLVRQVDMEVLRAVQHRYFSALSMISERVFKKGCEDLGKHIEKTGGSEKEEILCYILIGEKRV